MVISQIAGVATAFGTGELSGAGFGPNYTILMKLGYEFFAPRILEEMEKNPNVFFQDTLWFQKFQKQIKLYSDKVMQETLNTLINIPQKTLDQISDKFKEEGSSAIPSLGAPNIPTTVSPALNQIITLTKVVEGLIKQIQNMNFTFNIVPQAFGALPPQASEPAQDFPPASSLPGQGPGESALGPELPPEGLQQPDIPGFKDDRLRLQQAHEIKWDAFLKVELTKIANEVNKATALPNPPKRNKTQSSNIDLATLVRSNNSILQGVRNALTIIKGDYGNLIRIKLGTTILKKQLALYQTRQLQLVRHIKLYR